MPSIEEITRNRVKAYTEKEANFDFPDFIALMRQTHHKTRKQIEIETGVTVMTQFKLEQGTFIEEPKICHLAALSDYYGVDIRMLKRKCQEFMMKKEFAGKKMGYAYAH